MKKNLFFISFISIIAFSESYGQEIVERCAVPKIEQLRIKQNNSLLKKKSQFESDLKIINKITSIDDISEIVLVKIPVVVHVVYKNATTNISDAQIKTQIDILNEDYRRKANTRGFNNNPVGEDMNIEFFLATTDPTGKATNGITRTLSERNYDIFSEYSLLPKVIKWNTEKYLNIWVTSLNSSQLGYGGFPYDSNLPGIENIASNLEEQKSFDGLIVDYKVFGKTTSKSYGLGRTTTHEIGHWLGLLHPNADDNCGDDFCSDTPQINDLNSVTTCNERFSNCTGAQTRNMIENYMDYSPDACMNIFTKEQAKRVRSVFNLSKSRKILANQFVKLPESEMMKVTISPNPVSKNFTVRVLLKGTENLKFSFYDFSGKSIKEDEYGNVESKDFEYESNLFPSGMYYLRIQSSRETSVQRLYVSH
jgi:Pregnancy-associated plasma protein-A/Secretion system C-terminal sorting domain